MMWLGGGLVVSDLALQMSVVSSFELAHSIAHGRGEQNPSQDPRKCYPQKEKGKKGKEEEEEEEAEAATTTKEEEEEMKKKRKR
ncbi:hypothetical protein PoB_001000600 [Plakobranchus ocellatus]|uniref:Secreted protein n=1 Tax=Plakobranchus ocellatus TaxID=259542 RepID=A0AAV3YM75_9GAST|nr:hypothetical protein PoB_001000600 [Plakobranchus ocellatus]